MLPFDVSFVCVCVFAGGFRLESCKIGRADACAHCGCAGFTVVPVVQRGSAVPEPVRVVSSGNDGQGSSKSNVTFACVFSFQTAPCLRQTSLPQGRGLLSQCDASSQVWRSLRRSAAPLQKHHKLGRDTEEIEVAPSPANCHTKPRKMDQQSCRVEPRTCHLDKNSKESRKTSQEMGRRRG